MNAKKCDRCGQYYAHYNGKSCGVGKVNTVGLKDEQGVGFITFDLCPACMDKQIRFLRGTELTSGENK